MKIKKSSIREEVKFGTLGDGDTFTWDGNTFVKFGPDCDAPGMNAFNLEDNVVVEFDDDDMVTPVDAELVIR